MVLAVRTCVDPCMSVHEHFHGVVLCILCLLSMVVQYDFEVLVLYLTEIFRFYDSVCISS